jgi:hypothetical protein
VTMVTTAALNVAETAAAAARRTATTPSHSAPRPHAPARPHPPPRPRPGEPRSP